MIVSNALHGVSATAHGQCRHSHHFFQGHHQAGFRQVASHKRQAKCFLGLTVVVRAAAATAMPDIQDRLDRFEWDRMKLADLTGDIVILKVAMQPVILQIALNFWSQGTCRVRICMPTSVCCSSSREDSTGDWRQLWYWLRHLSGSGKTECLCHPDSQRCQERTRVSLPNAALWLFPLGLIHIFCGAYVPVSWILTALLSLREYGRHAMLSMTSHAGSTHSDSLPKYADCQQL